MCILTLVAVYTAGWREDNLKWEDNFDFLDEAKWHHVITGNRGEDDQFQYYRKDKRNSYVKNGTLHLRATLVSDELSDFEIRRGSQLFPGCNVEPCFVQGMPNGDCVLPVYSAQIHTKDLLVRRGRIQVRAKLPSGDWLRSEITLLPSQSVYGVWPMSGEIVVADGCGNKNLTTPDGHSICRSAVRQTLHWSATNFLYNTSYYNKLKKTEWETVLPEGYFSDEFHVFEVEWTGDHIAFLIDGRETGKVVPPEGGFWELGGFSLNNHPFFNPWAGGSVMAPFDRPFYLVLKLSVGGSFFDDVLENCKHLKPWNPSTGHPITDFYENSKYYAPTWEKPELEVDYVRVYEE